MNAIIFLIPISLMLAGVALIAFLWTLRTRQYGDPEGDSHRILMAEDAPLTIKPAPRKGMPKTCDGAAAFRLG